MRNRRFLLTGGAGFVGSHLLDALLARGDEVTVIDCFDPYYDPAEKWANLEPHRGNDQFRLLEGSVCDPEIWARLEPEEGWTAVVHLAARAGVRPSMEDPVGYVESNVGGTVQALRWSASASRPIPFVLASSSSVYGDANDVPYSEGSARLAPVSPYAASKVGAEQMVQAWRRSYGLPSVALRFFTVYGPRQRPDLAIRKFVKLLLSDEPLPLFGDGSSARDYTHVSDIVDGTLRALDRLVAAELPSSVYNLGSDRTISLTALVEMLEAAVGRAAHIDRKPMQAGDVRRTWAELSRSRRELDYSPSVELKDGIEDFVRWMRSR